MGAVGLDVGGKSPLALWHSALLGLAVGGKEPTLSGAGGHYHQHVLPLGVDNNLKEKETKKFVKTTNVQKFMCTTGTRVNITTFGTSKRNYYSLKFSWFFLCEHKNMSTANF